MLDALGNALPGALVTQGRMPPLPSVEVDPFLPAFLGAAFFLAAMTGSAVRLAAMRPTAPGAATLKADALREVIRADWEVKPRAWRIVACRPIHHG